MSDAHITATLHSLYWRAGGRRTASVADMLRRIVDDGSHLCRQRAFTADFESILIALLANGSIACDEEWRLDLLELACEAGYAALAARLLASRQALAPESAALCMITALAAEHALLVGVLLDAGLSPHSCDECGIPLFSHAIATGNSAIIDLLVGAGAGPDQEGHALATAAILGDTDLLQLCLAHGASQPGLDNAFALSAAAAQPEAMAVLLDAGACAEPALRQARQAGDEERTLLIRSLLFAHGCYDQLLSLKEIRAAALALLPPVAALIKPN